MKVLFYGLGSIGKRHAKIINELFPDVKIYALRSNKGVNNQLNIERYINDIYDEKEAFLLKPDIVFITNPTSMHIKSGIAAGENKCHIFMEKPLSNNLENVEGLLNLVKRERLVTLMGCNMRFHPIILKIRELVQNQVLGKALSFSVTCGSYLPEWRPWQDYSKSYSASKELGGGVVLDLIHEIDYARYLFGDFKAFKSIIGKSSNLNIETEDYADIILKTDKGISGSIHLDYFRRQSKRQINVTFENGTLCADLINNNLSINGNIYSENIKYDIDRDYMYKEQIKYFIHCVKNKENTFNDINEGFEVLKLAMKIKENGEL